MFSLTSLWQGARGRLIGNALIIMILSYLCIVLISVSKEVMAALKMLRCVCVCMLLKYIFITDIRISKY